MLLADSVAQYGSHGDSVVVLLSRSRALGEFLRWIDFKVRRATVEERVEGTQSMHA